MYAIDPEEHNIGKHQDQLDNDKNISKTSFLIDNKIERKQYLQQQFAKPEQIIVKRIVTLGKWIPDIENKPIHQTTGQQNHQIQGRQDTEYNMHGIIAHAVGVLIVIAIVLTVECDDGHIVDGDEQDRVDQHDLVGSDFIHNVNELLFLVGVAWGEFVGGDEECDDVDDDDGWSQQHEREQ